MKIHDKRNSKEANIGDMIITNKGNKYILLINTDVDKNFPIAVFNIGKDNIDFTTQQGVFCIGGTLMDETIVEIISRYNIKIVIEN